MKHLLLFIITSLSLVITAPMTVMADDGYTLVWSDEFDGTSLNTNAWNIETGGGGWGNNELETYSADNISVSDGCLVITAKRSNDGTSFTSGRLHTLGKAAFKYGKVEARIKLPSTANGLWPAFWMMGNDIGTASWPACGEIDIMEAGNSGAYADNTQKRLFSGAMHWGATSATHQYVSNNCLPGYDVEDDFQLITLIWTDTKVDMYINLDKYPNEGTYCSWNLSDLSGNGADYFKKRFFILFNMAIGGNFTGITDASGITALPNAGDEKKMYVDYVRVYQKTGSEDNIVPADYLTDTSTSLGDYGSLSLDGNNNSTFDFSKGNNYVILDVSSGVKTSMGSGIRADYSVDWTKYLKTVWNGYDYKSYTSGVNSFGESTAWNDYVVKSNVTWSGLAYTSSSGNGKDLSMLDEDNYYLHFSMRGTDATAHSNHAIWIGQSKFAIGNAAFVDAGASATYPVLGDYKRDGRWCSFDIPISKLKTLANPLFSTDGGASAFAGNAFVVLSGGTAGTEVQYDNIFFYKKLLYLDHTTADGVAVLGGAWDATQFATIDAAHKATAYDLTSVDNLPSSASLSPADPNALFIVPAAGKIAKNEVVKNADGSGYTGTNIQFSELWNDNAITHDVCTAISPITVTGPQMRRTFSFSSSGIYFTTVVPFDVATLPSGIKAYNLTSSVDNNGTVVLKFTEVASLAKGTPYLIYSTSADVQFGGSATVDFTRNPVAFTGGTFTDTYTAITGTTESNGYYIFKKNATEAKMYKSVGGNIPAFRSYVQLTGSSSNAKILNLEFDDATGIHLATDAAIRSLLNVYSIDGKTVERNVQTDALLRLPAGIFVVNGKKIVVK